MKKRNFFILALTTLTVLSGCKGKKIDDSEADRVLGTIKFSEACKNVDKITITEDIHEESSSSESSSESVVKIDKEKKLIYTYVETESKSNNSSSNSKNESYIKFDGSKVIHVDVVKKEYHEFEIGAETYFNVTVTTLLESLRVYETQIAATAKYLIGLKDKTGYNYSFYSSGDNNFAISYNAVIKNGDSTGTELLKAEIKDGLVSKYDYELKGKDTESEVEVRVKHSASIKFPSLKSYTKK